MHHILHELEQDLRRAESELYRLRHALIESVPAPYSKLLSNFMIDCPVTEGEEGIVRWVSGVAKQIVTMASQHNPGRRIPCPLCMALPDVLYARGFAMPTGLRRHLLGQSRCHQCDVMGAIVVLCRDLLEQEEASIQRELARKTVLDNDSSAHDFPTEGYGRLFEALFVDSIVLIEDAAVAPRGLEETYARSASLAALLLLETVANTCLDVLALPRATHDEIDRLPMVAKLDLFVRLQFPDRTLDRGRHEVGVLRELKGIRDRLAHPKRYPLKFNTDRRSWHPATENTPVLDVPRSAEFWGAPTALKIMRGVHEFLRYFFRDLLQLTPENVAALLLSESAVPELEGQLSMYKFGISQAAVKRAGIDLSYIDINFDGWPPSERGRTTAR